MFLLVSTGVARAQAPNWPRESPPAPLEAREVDFPPYEIRTLPNGLQVVAVLHHEQPAVSLRLLVRAGSASESADKLGLANLTASLLNQGTQSMTAEAFADEIDFIGAAAGAGAGTDLTFVNMIVMKDSFNRGMRLLADMARRPAFAPAEIERQRQQMLSSLQVSFEDPGFVADAVFDRLVYGFHPYGLPASGTPETIPLLTRDDITAFHQKFFVPNNAILAIVGDVTAEETFAQATEVFGDWARREIDLPTPADPPPPARRVIVVNKPDAVQTEVRVGQLGIARQNEHFMAVDLLLRILGGEGSNRLHQVLRNERSLTYGASADLHALKGGGDFEAETNTRSDATAEVLQVMVEEFWRLQREPVRRYEIEGAKAYLTGNFPLSIETPDAIALQVLNSLFYELPLEELETFRERVNDVTAADIQQQARELLRPDRLSIVLVGNAAAFTSALRGVGFGTFELVQLDELDLLEPDFKQRQERPRAGARAAAPASASAPRAAYQLTAAAIPQATTDAADARAVLERAIAAKGGLASLKRVEGLKATAVAPFNGPRGESGEVETTTWVRFPDQVRIETTLPDAEIVQVYDGRHAWIRDPGGVHEVPDEVAGSIGASLHRDTIPLLLAAENGRIEVRRLLDVREESRTEHLLEFTGDDLGDQQPLILYLDAESGRVTRQTYPSGVPDEPLIEERFTDYRDVDGVQIPFVATVTRGDERLAERRLTDVTINPPADPERFTRPAS